ncbi:hypothetical protein B0A78_13810 [Flavobacterium columnare NBRC 100251 = ATCC 23463]|uniref:HNH endonuclease n=1 Tax=Flavobacterium columnare TaxID=996 RepID=UPI000BE85C7A|nr:hypothetical protein [Flavobacterium columnare]MBF6654018.1 hypothetical protein [Flavobacterium columnare]MBF6654600.1 hypothetical protein [Flavobacterium columnare]MBF6659038.1 hypothetical protein [Flavobacterium columnare]PDS21743.1 hypothetical protein B0A78_13810 [Flavobacterium columnare NBRC 100251 = ATCC 23463]GEM59158.1 hypothetical protein FC1_23960 [Flavobacterium columnare NBRC 100251 = ATCC 23463]
MIKLQPNNEAVKFHYDEVSRTLNSTSIKRNNTEVKLNENFLIFLNTYKEDLISGLPSRLLELHREYLQLEISEDDRSVIKDFFINTGYKNFKNKVFLEKLGFNTCAYCNRNYTLQIVDDRARAQLDHWFPKETFYILALSLYNLIPSCPSCNHIKLNNAPDDGWENALNNLNHPYLECNNFKFSYEYRSLEDFNLKIDVEKDSKTDNTLKFNRIEEIYNAHSNLELKDLVHLRSKYSDTFLNIVKDSFGGIMSKEEAYRIIFGVEEKAENFHKRPFSKFKTDIIDELLNDNKNKFET